MYKLVRDNIPELIKESGEVCDYAAVQNDELYVSLLKDKLIEEVNEFLWADPTVERNLEELIDITTVIKSLVAALGISEADFETKYTEKLTKNGGFVKKYVAFFADAPTQENK